MGLVRVLVPVPQDLLGGDVAPPQLREPEAVGLHVGSEPPVVGDVGEPHLDLRQHAVKREPLQEEQLLVLVQEVTRGEGGVHGHPAPQLDDLGVYHLHALLAGHRDAVVAVPDEVGVPDLVQRNRRQLLGADHRPVYLLPASPEAFSAGQERPVEVLVAPDAPHDLLDRHDAHREVRPFQRPQRAPDLVEGEQPVGGGVLAQVSPETPQKGAPPRPGEVPVGLLV